MSKKDFGVTEKVKDATNLNQQIINDLESMVKFLEEQQVASLTQDDKDTRHRKSEGGQSEVGREAKGGREGVTP